jgi:glycosyltransferase
MRVSVITVAYNSAKTISDTLQSVAEQSYSDIEYIVVDGASADETTAIVGRYGRTVSMLISEPDRGIYDAMNKGLKLASGDLIGFLNADDMFAHSGAVASIAQAALQNPGADAIYGDLVYVRQDEPGKSLRYWRSGEFSRSRLRFGWMPPHPTFYLRSNRLAKLGVFSDHLKIAADYDFVLRCLNRPDAQAAYIPEVLVRMRAGGASNRSLAALLNKSREDLWALRTNGLSGWPTLICKNLRKLPQFFRNA